MTSGFVHPTTGQLQEATEPNLAAAVDDGFRAADKLKQERLDLLDLIQPLRVALAEMRGPAKLPERRHRTATQDIVAACPRCGDHLPHEDAA